MLALLGAGLYFLLAGYAARAADRAFDQLLLASALSIAESIQVDGATINVDLPYASLALLATGRRDRIFYRVAAPDGSLITGYPDLAYVDPAGFLAQPALRRHDLSPHAGSRGRPGSARGLCRGPVDHGRGGPYPGRAQGPDG